MNVELLEQTNTHCPCGAAPRAGSPYCSWDCEPTHIPAFVRLDADDCKPWTDPWADVIP